ncbi:MAG: phosphotransferase [Pseudomonadota bacterium]
MAEPDAREVAVLFGLGQPSGKLELAARGQQNSFGVHRLQTDRGCYAVKQFDVPPSSAALAVEAAAFQAGLPLPEPIKTNAGDFAASLQVDGQRRWLRVYRWVTGTAMPWGLVDPEISFEIGSLMAAVHLLPVPESELSEPPWLPLTESGWIELASRAKAQGVAWTKDLKHAVPSLLKQEEFLVVNSFEGEARVPSHRDLHPPNIIKSTHSKLCVVDWDAAGTVVGRHDVANFALVWATPEGNDPNPAAVHAFIDGYRKGGGQ